MNFTYELLPNIVTQTGFVMRYQISIDKHHAYEKIATTSTTKWTEKLNEND